MNDTYSAAGIDPYAEPEKTSVAAVIGFVLSLIGCCGGITALLGVPLSVIGLIGIGKSGGRVGGKGFGIAGLLIGLLMLALWGGCLGVSVFGINSAVTQFGEPVARSLDSIQQDNFDAARANMSPIADAVTNEELIAFREDYRSTLGEFQSFPSGVFDYISMFAELGPISQAMNGQNNVFPIPANFDAGPALVMIRMDQQSGAIIGVTIIDLAGNEYDFPTREGSLPAPTPAEPDKSSDDGP